VILGVIVVISFLFESCFVLKAELALSPG
jgi:hypothetical protein